MKTPSEIADALSQVIAHIYLRPSMHVGHTDAPYSANAVDAVLWHLHYVWSDVHNRSAEFRDIAAAQRKAADCDCLGFADAFYHFHKNAAHSDAFRFVMRNWREISVTLGMPLDDGSGRNALDADF